MGDQISYFVAIVLTFLCFVFTACKTWKFTSRSAKDDSAMKFPPGPRKLPLIGHLHLLIGSVPHRALRDLANKYGTVMLLQLGEVPTVVVSTPEAAKQVMKTKDSNFVNRPHLYAAETVTYNFQDIVFSRGDYWRQMRKICVLELLTSRRVQSFRSIRDQHVLNMIKSISEKEGSTINLRSMLYTLSVGIVSQAAFGGKCKHQEAFKRVNQEIVALFGGLSIVDVYPSFKLLHFINKLRPKYRGLHQKVDGILESIIDEHKADKSAEANDFVQLLLSIQERGDFETALSTTSIKAIILDVFLAGSEPSSTILEWAMIELLKNPKVMEMAQAEVRDVFGKKGYVDEAELGQLEYINQIIKETCRLHPPAPLLLPRESKEACEINGFQIPAKTRIIVNAFAIGRDPNHWNEPEKFDPERFSDILIDFKGSDFELIPFGGGRRMCPGMSFGMAIVELTLANLLYHFDWKLPDGNKPEDMDMTEVFRAAVRTKKELCLVPIRYIN